MPLWRRKPLHERLAEQGGLTEEAAVSHAGLFRGLEAGVHGVARPREWDVVATALAPDLEGDAARFVALPDGSLLVEDEAGDDFLAPLADAVEASLSPPYRAEAVRQTSTRWAVAARGIEVVELPEDVAGDEIELAGEGGERTLLVDGARTFGSIPALERLAAGRFDSYAVHAERLDGMLWEVRISPL